MPYDRLLAEEIAARLAVGAKQITVSELSRKYADLGYRLDRSMDCRSLARYMGGDRAGASYPCCTTGVVESDTGMSAFHYRARRDARFRAMQELRMGAEFFAVSRGCLLEP